MTITVFQARKILTMNPQQPEATHVAVREGRVLAVGDTARMQALGDFKLDARYADQVLMPGLVEGHSHLMAGGLWKFTFVGYHARTSPDGRVWEGCRNFEEVIERLQAAEQAIGDPTAPLMAWGFDPLFFGTERMTADHLDRVSTQRPVVVLHASQHLMNVNRAAMAAAGITRDTEVEGVARFQEGEHAGEPTGELQEFAAMFPIRRLTGNIFRVAGADPSSLHMFGQMAQLAGVTTATDLVNDLSDANAAALHEVTTTPGFPVRLVPAYLSLDGGLNRAQGGERIRMRQAGAAGNNKLHYGLVKIVADGSIQGFTARLCWPGYHNGAPNGIWILPPAELKAAIKDFHAQGFQLHIHTNGDEATEVALDGIEEALAAHPRWDHRHTLQHCQMASEAQFARMGRLGVCANLFTNHIYYWGDAHRELTMGPDRANRMDACATALSHDVPLAIHSDAPITPLAPLFTAWCAVNRLTSSGQTLGSAECITVPQALYAITMGAAFTLRMDHLIGSIEVGKFADFCVLAEDPLDVAPNALKDVPVTGTVLGGQPLALPGQAQESGRPFPLTTPDATRPTGAIGLERLVQQVNNDLARLNWPALPWMPPAVLRDGEAVLDTAIIGGGQAGLAAAAALQRHGIQAVVFDRAPEGFEGPWATTARMQTLRTPKGLTGPALGVPSLTFRAWFEAQFGFAAWDALDQVPRLQWMAYLRWFRQVLRIDLRNACALVDLQPVAEGVTLVLRTAEGTRRHFARRVVLATGRDGLGGPVLPSFLKGLRRNAWAHSAEAWHPDQLRGLRVAVVGAGASAMDSAASALEAGAHRVDLLIRRPDIPRIHKSRGTSAPGLTHGHPLLSDAQRWQVRHYVNSAVVPPPRPSTLRVSRHANAHFHVGCPVLSVQQAGDALRVRTPRGEMETDFLIVSTGFQVDWTRRPEFARIAPYVRSWRKRYTPPAGLEDEDLARSPDLGPAFEFLPHDAQDCPGLDRIHCFCWPALLSHGAVCGDVPSISDGARRLADGMAALFYREDFEHHFAQLQAFDEPELMGDEWLPAPDFPHAMPLGTALQS